MGLWPFGKKKDRSKSAYAESAPVLLKDESATPPFHAPVIPPPPLGEENPFSDSVHVFSDTQQRAYNKEAVVADASDPVGVQPYQGSVEDITALPTATELERSPHLRPVLDPSDRKAAVKRSISKTDVAKPDKIYSSNRSGTVRSKRSIESPSLFRHKSSKARKDDAIREEQVKAMSSPIPIPTRPNTEGGATVRRDSKRVRDSLSRLSNPPDSTRAAGSARSSITANSDHHFRFNVGSLDMFSPKPTIRHTETSNHGPWTPTLGAPSKAKSRKDDRQLQSRGTTRGNKRIDALADDLDGKTIREVLERDQKRREKKRQTDEERALRRLQRRADKQRALEIDDPNELSADPGHRPEEMSAGMEATTSADTRPMRPTVRTVEQHPPENLMVPEVDRTLKPPRSPFADAGLETPHSAYATPLEEPADSSILPVIATQQHARNASNLSHLTDPRSLGGETEATENDRRDSDMSAPRSDINAPKFGAWTSIFRRGKAGSEDRGPRPPSEASFSNTSRESMTRQALPAHLQQRSEQPRDGSGTPVRVQSIFREDLPELPISPPDSRVQSPEVGDNSPVAIPPRSELRLSAATGRRSARDSVDQTWSDSPTGSAIAGSGVVLSQSLASVDSEASWLSGKPKKTLSQQTVPGSTTLAEHSEEPWRSPEEKGTFDENYYRRVTPGPEPSWLQTTGSRYATLATGLDSEQVTPGEREAPEEVTQGEVAHTPTIVPLQTRVKSQEGLLNMTSEENDDTDSGSFDGDEEGEEEQATILERATSVSYPTHARQVSAGSARLLELQPTDEENTTLERATSISYQGHARQVSAGSAKLLDMPPTPRRIGFSEQK